MAATGNSKEQNNGMVSRAVIRAFKKAGAPHNRSNGVVALGVVARLLE